MHGGTGTHNFIDIVYTGTLDDVIQYLDQYKDTNINYVDESDSESGYESDDLRLCPMLKVAMLRSHKKKYNVPIFKELLNRGANPYVTYISGFDVLFDACTIECTHDLPVDKSYLHILLEHIAPTLYTFQKSSNSVESLVSLAYKALPTQNRASLFVPSSVMSERERIKPRLNKMYGEDTLLTHAIRTNGKFSIKCMALLLQFGADINVNPTPLMYVCNEYRNYPTTRYDKIIGFLLSRNANINIRDYKLALTPLEFACKYNIDKLLSLFIKYGMTINDRNGSIIIYRTLDQSKMFHDKDALYRFLKMLLENMTPALRNTLINKTLYNCGLRKDRTALQITYYLDNIKCTKLLLKFGADINGTDKDGKTLSDIINTLQRNPTTDADYISLLSKSLRNSS